MVKAGVSLVMAISVYSLTANTPPAIPTTVIELAVRLLLELALGYLVALLVHFFFMWFCRPATSSIRRWV